MTRPRFFALSTCLIATYAAAQPAAPSGPQRPGPFRTADELAASDGLTAAALGLEPGVLARLHRDRALTNHAILTMPAAALARAVRRVTSPASDHPQEWARWRARAWADEKGQVASDALARAMADAEALRAIDAPGGLSAAGWQDLGPNNIGGRVRALAIHPAAPDTIWAGGVAGGVWRSTNAGVTWTPVADALSNLAVSTIALHPTNPQVLWVGTGEGFFSPLSDGFFNGDPTQGAGIFGTTNGGATWTQLPNTPLGATAFQWVNRLALSPNAGTLLAGTRGGIRRSTDGGATWSTVFPNAGQTSVHCYDVDFHPTDSLRCVANVKYVVGTTTFSTVIVSTNGGATWTNANGISTLSDGLSGRIELAYHRGWTGGLQGCVYAFKDLGNGTLYRSLDGGANFTQVFVANVNPIIAGQGWYDLALWVDPTDVDANPLNDTLLVGALDLWRAQGNGGTAFAQVSSWFQFGSVHADQHAIIDRPGQAGRVFIGCDGGVYEGANAYAPSIAWQNRSQGLRITQFYGGSRRGNGVLLGGTQDNGTLSLQTGAGTTWTSVAAAGGGDGGFCASDPSNPLVHYGEYVYGRVHRSTDGGISSDYICGQVGLSPVWKNPPYRITDAMPGVSGQAPRANFIAPVVMDPTNSNRLYVGCERLWRTNDAQTANTATTGPSWTPVTSTPLVPGQYISAIAVNPANTNEIWIGFNNGDLFQSSNGGASFIQRDSAAVPNRVVNRIRFVPNTTTQLIATFGGFAGNNIWRYTGSTWFSIPTSGISAPIRDIAFHPTDPTCMLAASEVGLLTSANSGSTWSTAASPMVVPIDEIVYSAGYFHLFTHGRGVLRQSPFPPPQVVSVGSPCEVTPGGGSPSLAMTLPYLAGSTTVTLTNGPPGSLAFLFLTIVPAVPIPITPLCFAWIDLSTPLTPLVVLPVSAAGTAAIAFPIPDDPTFVGGSLALQAATILGAGVGVSNGLNLTVGY